MSQYTRNNPDHTLPGYDRWKTAAPPDPEPDTTCPECGELCFHDDIVVVNIEGEDRDLCPTCALPYQCKMCGYASQALFDGQMCPECWGEGD